MPVMPGRRRLAVSLAAVVAVVPVVLAVTALSRHQPASRAGAPPTGGSSSGSVSASVRPSASTSPSPTLQAPIDPTTPPAAAGVPVSLSVPRVGIRTGLQQLGVLSDGTLQSPSAWQVAGWYSRGPKPGDVGPAVIAGHVDSVNGPAVFYHLRDMVVGDHMTVTDSAKHVRHFTVTAIDEYPKRTFPSDAVYGPTPLPELRLVTCTGDFDYSKRSYVDNLVVTAVLDGRTVPVG